MDALDKVKKSIADSKKVEQLLADDKLNPIYMEDGLEELVNILPTQSMTKRLFKYSIGRLELTEEQIKALISDIDVLKAHNIWDVETEQQTLKRCKKNIEDAEAYKLLSASDKAKYDAERLKRFESYKI